MTVVVPGLPSDWSGCLITGTFLYSNGLPVSNATFKLTPSPDYMLDAANKDIILGASVTGHLDVNGRVLSVDGLSYGMIIAASDDPSINPTGWTWNFSFLTPPAAKAQFTPFDFDAPSNTTLDLIDAAPVSSSNGVVITRGDPGIITIAFGATAPPPGTPIGTYVGRLTS